MGCYQSRLQHNDKKIKTLLKQENKILEEINEILEEKIESNTNTKLGREYSPSSYAEEEISISSDTEFNLVNYSD